MAIIGGTPPLLTFSAAAMKHVALLANARCGIAVAIDMVTPGAVWLPEYLCPTMVDAVPAGLARFYDVSTSLQISGLDDVKSGDMVIFIDYFGWPTDPNDVAWAKGRGAWVLMDMSQALLGIPNVEADFLLYSPPKFLPVPDGGVLVSPRLELALPLTDVPYWWCGRAAAMEHRRRREGDNETWYRMFLASKADAPIGRYAMSAYTETAIAAIDVIDVAERRRDNFRTLLGLLPAQALKGSLPDDVVPLGFPVVLPDRDRVREAMFAAGIFPPVHWQLRHPLSPLTMTLPCDQRYGADDMSRMAESLLAAVKRRPQRG